MLQIQKNKDSTVDVFNLIHNVYALEGYTTSFDDFMSYKDRRTTFTLAQNEKLIGTLSLIECTGEETLPLSSLYQDELGQLLTKYKKVYEVGSFAMDKQAFKNSFSKESLQGTRMLFKAILDEAKSVGADILVIVINPKHLTFYKLMGFQEFGEQKFYPVVHAPAIPLYLDLTTTSLRSSFFTKV